MPELIMPTEEQHQHAIAKAWEMRNEDADNDFVAKTLLSHEHRIQKLQAVMDAAGHFLHSGLAGKEHHILEVAIAEAKKAAYVPGAPLSIDDELLL